MNKRRHIMDKFGRVRHHMDSGDGDHIDMGGKRLKSVGEPRESDDALTKGYLETLFTALERRVGVLEGKQLSGGGGMAVANGMWDAKGLKITNTAAGTDPSDVSTLAQTCTYDAALGKFKCGNKYFELVENLPNAPVVTAVQHSAHSPVELTRYKDPFRIIIPGHSVRWDTGKRTLADYKGMQIVWDESGKRFTYRP